MRSMRNVFSIDPVEANQQRNAQPKEPEYTFKNDDGSTDYLSLSATYQVPPNILRATTELGGIDGKRAAEVLRDALKRTNGDVPAAVKSILGDDAATQELLNHATKLTRPAEPQAEPTRASADQPGIIGDTARMAGGGIVKGTAAVVEGTGRAMNAINPREKYQGEAVMGEDGIPDLKLTENTDVPSVIAGATEAADKMRGVGEAIQAGISDASRGAVENSTPDGDILDPTTWTLGEDPSLRGYLMLSADVLGSMAPVIAAALAGGTPAALGVGGAQSAGSGSELARQEIDAAAADVGPDGVSRLERESAYYRELLAQGVTPADALARTRHAGEQIAALYTAPVGALGGAATGQIVSKGVTALAGRDAATRIAGTAAISGAEEAVQETTETLAARKGVEDGAGLDVDLTEGTFGDALLGFLGGAVTGGASGVPRRDQEGDTEAPADPALTGPSAPNLLAPPPRALGAPEDDGGDAPSDEIEQIASEGVPEASDGPTSLDEQVDTTSGVPAVQDTIGSAEPNLERPALGPLSRAAARIEAPTQEAPKPKSRMRVTTPEGADLEAIFDSEDAGGINLTFKGSPWRIPREDIADGTVTIEPIDPLLEDAERRVDEAAAELAKDKDFLSGPVKADDWGANEIPDDMFPVPTPATATPPVSGDAGTTPTSDRTDAPATPHADIEAAAQEIEPEPTDAQKEAGNYKKGHVKVQGLDISIENAKGAERSGTDPNGERWSVTMPAHYGYIKRTEGADGDHVDVYLGDMPDSDAVYIVNQIDPDSGAFDEHKVLLGTGSRAAAQRLYEAGFSDGRGKERMGSMTATTMDGFKAWLKDGDQSKPTEPIRRSEPAESGQAEAPEVDTSQDEPMTRAVREAIARGPVTHTTRRNKELTGYVVREVEGVRLVPKTAKEIDKYAFRKDGGWFMREGDVKSAFPDLFEVEADQEPVKKEEPEKTEASEVSPARREEPVKKPEVAEREPQVKSGYGGYVPQSEFDRWEDDREARKGLKVGMRVTHTNNAFDPPRDMPGVIKYIDKRGYQATVEVERDSGGTYTIGASKLTVLDDAPGEKPRNPPKADAPMGDHTGDIDGYGDGGKYEDGRDAPAKDAFLKDASRWARRVSSLLIKEDGYKKPINAKGKEITPVRTNTGGVAGSGDVYMDVRTPDGAYVAHLTINADSSFGRSKKNGVFINFQIKDGGRFVGSNRYPGGDLAPSDMAEVIRGAVISAAATDTKKDKPKAPDQQAGPRVFVNYVGRDGKTDAERGGPLDETPDTIDAALEMARGDLPTGYTVTRDGLELTLRNPDSKIMRRSKVEPGMDANDRRRRESADTILKTFKGVAEESAEQAALDAQEGNEAPRMPKLPSGTKATGPSLGDMTPERAREIALQLVREGKEDRTGMAPGFRYSGGQYPGRNRVKTTKGHLFIEPPRALDAYYFKVSDLRGELQGQASDTVPSRGSILSALSDEKQARAAELKKRIADKVRNQTSSGLDPEYITLGSELVALYVEAGTKRFAAILSDFIETTGLTPREAQAPMRAAYNFQRDEMELAGEDITGMDSADEVMAEVRRAIADTSTSTPEAGTVPAADSEVNGSGKRADQNSGEGLTPDTGQNDRGLGEGGEPEAAAGVPDGQSGGDRPDRALADTPAQDGFDFGDGEGAQAAGTRADRPKDRGRTGKPASGDAADGRGGTGSERLASDGAGDGGRPADGDAPIPDRGTGGNLKAPRRAASPSNYVIHDPEALIAGGPKTRFGRNRAAIEAYQSITSEGRDPTPEDLDAMASYIGWGSFGQELFQGSWDNPRPKDGWQDQDKWLREHLGKDDWQSAQRSIINAHYTDPPTVQAMWDMVARMGFKGGRVLEPSMGIGNFFGLMPQKLAAKSELTGIELDSLTGGMAKILYPDANISIKGYEKSQTPDDFYDLVIGNWPFAKEGPVDRRYAKLDPSLHDYFFVKALDQVRPGGLVIGITSAGTMDKKARNIRMHLARNAELVDAFRLPSGSFEKYAGTAVVTDIIILKKREVPVAVTTLSDAEQAWIDTAEVETPAGPPITVNRYFAENPGKVLGRLNFGSGTTYGRAAMIVDRPADLMDRLKALPDTLPADTFQPPKRGVEERFVSNNTGDRFGAVVVSNGELFVSRGEVMTPLEDVVKYKLKDKEKTAKREAELKGLVDLRSLYGALIDAERDGAADMETKRTALRKAYQAFRKAHGRIQDSQGLKLLERKAISDPYTAILKALETNTGEPSRIMTEPSVRSLSTLKNPTISQAFVMARNETVSLDIARIAELANATEAAVTDELLKTNAIYRVPGGGFEVADVFLSGNARKKMRELLDAKERGEDVGASIEALKEVVPEDIPYYKIEAKLGATWVRDQDYVDYIAAKLSAPDNLKSKITAQFVAGGWKINFGTPALNNRPEASSGAGHPDVKFSRLVQAAMNNQTLTVKKRDQDGEYVDDKATAEVNDKISRFREDFADWLWSDAERRVDLEAAYNEALNAIAIPRYDGSFLEFPGMALQLGENEFNLRSHQVNAIWRGLVNKRGLYAHEVGTGKTFTMAGIAVESRRYGIAQKPLVVAHNANSAAVAAEFNMMYPGAKVLYINNLSPKEIDTEMRRIKNEDWDAIVVPHSVIDRFALTEDTLNDLAMEEIIALESEALAAAEEDGAHLTEGMMDDPDEMKKVRSVTAKNLVRARNQIIQRIQKQAQRASKEGAIPFEELGVDMLIVDEVHEFKKPPISTKMQMKGLNTQTSARSIQLKFLTDYVKSRRNGTGVHTFTGTPITNTLTEIFHQMRYVMDDVMDRANVKDWDSWFNTFADASSDVELSADGQYEPVTRLSAFVNVAELRRMVGEFMDIVFADDMPEFKKRVTSSGKTMGDDLTREERDELLNGRTINPQGRPYKKIVNDIAEMGPAQSEIMKDLVERAQTFRRAGRKERREMMLEGSPNTPIRVETDAANASLDVRLFSPKAMDEETSKENRALRNIKQHFDEHPQATQVVFMERGFSDYATVTERDGAGEKTGTRREPRLNLAKDMRQKMIDQGIPADQIAIVDGGTSKEKRKEIADKMNKAEIRVVIGSTATLGVGVNMQKNLRAMHHMDAPWMPGDLEQRNGRGQRQGNQWNTVLEYRYITEKLDGRRWQVLTIKDQFIRAFLKADADVRVIDGEATADQEGEDADSLAQTLSDAAGDPRLLLVNKLKADIDKLERRERTHTQGLVDAKRRAKQLEQRAERNDAQTTLMRKDMEAAQEVIESDAFTAKIGATTFDKRDEAAEALDALLDEIEPTLPPSETVTLDVQVQGFTLEVYNSAVMGPQYNIKGARSWDIRTPSVRGIEQNIRSIPRKTEAFIEEEVNEPRAAAKRLAEGANDPFPQAEALFNKRNQLSDLEVDMSNNPAPPPAWLRNGAPVQTRIYVDGVAREVTGHRWASDGYFVLTNEGPVAYTEAKTEDGARIFDDQDFAAPVVEKTSSSDEKASYAAPKSRPVVATLTGSELGSVDGMRALRSAAVQWYRQTLAGTAVYSGALGKEVQFTRRGANKSVNTKGEDLVKLVPAVGDIIAKGQLVRSIPARGSNSDIKAMHVLAGRIMLDGSAKDVVVTVRETTQGNFHYDLSRDMSGGAQFRVAVPTLLQTASMEADATNLNIGEETPEVNLKAAETALADALKEAGIAGKVTGAVIEGLAVAGRAAQGRYVAGQIAVDPSTEDMIGTARHEIVHALRDAKLWGQPYGLFTKDEWQAMVRAARRDKALMAQVRKLYADQSPRIQIEEAVAERYRRWRAGRDADVGPARALFERMRDALEAIANGLSGAGFQSEAGAFRALARGDIGGRGESIATGPGSDEARARLGFTPHAPFVTANGQKGGLKKLTRSLMTRAMLGVHDGELSLLTLVPGRGLLAEMGRHLPGAQRYLSYKEKMDAMRNNLHNHMDDTAKAWRALLVKDKASNKALMDLMHESTIQQIDPSLPFVGQATKRDYETVQKFPNTKTSESALQRIREDQQRKAKYDALKAKYTALPAEFQAMYRTIRDEYTSLADKFEKAVLENARKAMDIGIRRAERNYKKRLNEIAEEGLKGKARREAIAEARQELENAKASNRFAASARLNALRAAFESNRLSGPYFPLARFGKLYATVRDEIGQVISFSKFEKEPDQTAFADGMRKRGYDVEVGAMADFNPRKLVDPSFVADIESLMGEIGASPMVMDEIWQRWLHTLPDMSVRTNRIHRKGTPGFDGDAFRAFGYNMNHGAHQLARLTYGIDLQFALEDAREDARSAPDPVRADLIVNEMEKRHDYVMSPQGSQISQRLTTAAFVWYLGVTPAAAISNITQTTVVGIPVLGAFHGRGGMAKAAKEITRALGDFTTGKGHAAESRRLSADEKAAMQEAYDRGIIDKSQAHDLTGVGETGAEYNRAWTAAMEKIAFFFHHAERMNREITFLAAYRMARDKGYGEDVAVTKAGDLTWRAHFDYQNTSRPRIMQNDWLRVALVFKNFQTNMLWRLFRDIHQSFEGASPADRQEARRQLIGITASMFVHAGIKGVWGYALLKTLLGMFLPGSGEDVEEEIEQALLALLPGEVVASLLQGVPGTLMGIDVTNRWGMPELWFRAPGRDMEGQDQYNYWVQEMIGAVPGIAEGFFRGAQSIKDGEIWKGIESMVPKFGRDFMRALRYFDEGATTYNGNPIIDDFSAGELTAQFIGFTPARLSRQYELNARDKNSEQRIMKERSRALRQVRKELREGEPISDASRRRIAEFNQDYPFYAITTETLIRSIKAGHRSTMNTKNGVYINPRLAPYISAKRQYELYN